MIIDEPKYIILLMKREFIDQLNRKWKHYFPMAEMPVGVFYSDDLHGARYVKRPLKNSRGYTCMFSQLSFLHRGEAVAFDRDNIGCFGAMKTIFGGNDDKEAEVKLLVEIEKFKCSREAVMQMDKINPKAAPTGNYLIMKPSNLLTEADDPEIFCIFANNDVISAMHTLLGFEQGRIDNIIIPFGSGCEQLLSFAFNEAKSDNPRAVLGGMDTAMRNCIKPDMLTLSIVARQMERIVSYMDDTFLGTYIWENLKKRHNLPNRKVVEGRENS